MPRLNRKWERRIDDFSHVRVGDTVKVQMGAGMERGTVSNRFKDHMLVRMGKRVIAVWDARNIERA